MAASSHAERPVSVLVSVLQSALAAGRTCGKTDAATLAARAAAWVGRLPGTVWLALPCVALLPVWTWSAARFVDGSDDPLGIVALTAIVVLVVRDRHRYGGTPHGAGLAVALLLTAAAALGTALPPLVRGVLAVLAAMAMLAALRRREQPVLALAGLGLLALPIVSSLQFFAGFPLRVVTAEATRILLALCGLVAERSGTALTVAGRLVMVDAPCAGIHMVWVAYFTACFAAVGLRMRDGHFLRRLPLVGLVVIAGNIVRNTVLVAKEAGVLHWPDWTHEGVGLAVFAGVCATVLQIVAGGQAGRGATPVVTAEQGAKARRAGALHAGAFASLVVLAATPWLAIGRPASGDSGPAHVEWPHVMDGRELRPLALSPVEERFASRFAGTIGRFTDGERVVVLRHVVSPTRMLHPAADCYRGLGYRVDAIALERQATEAGASMWRCFVAARAGERLRVCEQIVDATGAAYTDTSAWYWAATLGQSHGPWRAITRASPL